MCITKGKNFLKGFFISCAVLLGTLFLTGFTYPNDAPYCLIDCVYGSSVPIYFAVDDVDHLYVDDYYIINEYSETITAYCEGHQVTFETYQDGYITEETDSTVTYTDLAITAVVENNLSASSDSAISDYQPYIFALLGGLLLCSFISLVKD